MKQVSPAMWPTAFALLFLVLAVPPAMISQKPTPVATASGKRIFSQSCASCHDTLGNATKTGPTLKNYYRHQPRPSDAAVRNTIEQGKGKMPAFSTFNQKQINDLIAYLRTL